MTRERRNRRRALLVLLLALLLLLVAVVGTVAFSGPGPSAPTITATPPSPSASTSAGFSFSGDSGAALECRLDAAASFTACAGRTVYTELALGSHTFRVHAVKSGKTSGETTYVWTVAVPAAPTIVTKPSDPAKLQSAGFSFTTNESNAIFECALDGSAFAPCTTPKSYGGPLTDGSHTFEVRALGPSGSSAGTSAPSSYTWTVDHSGGAPGRDAGAGPGTVDSTVQTHAVDRAAPATPVLTDMPPDPSTTATSHFAWTDSTPADVEHYECSRENGVFQTCSTPLTFAVETTSNGEHQFAVRAVDAAGNASGAASYKWKVQKGSLQDFTITGSLASGGLLYPGGAARTISVTFHNPNGLLIHVTALTVEVDASSLPAGCQSSWFQVMQSNVSGSNTADVPANGMLTLPSGGVSAPRIRMLDSGNQNACRGATFQLTYSGSAQS